MGLIAARQLIAKQSTRGISKDKLDAYWLSKVERKLFCNDKAGVKALPLWAYKAGVSRVIFESTIARQGMRSMPEREAFIIAALKRDWLTTT